MKTTEKNIALENPMNTAELCAVCDELSAAHGYVMESLKWDDEKSFRFLAAMDQNAYQSFPGSAESAEKLRELNHTMLNQLLTSIRVAADALDRLENPGSFALDGRGVRVIVRSLDTYAVDSRNEVWSMRKVLETVSARRKEVTFWWVGMNEQTEIVGYDRFMNLADNLAGAFA